MHAPRQPARRTRQLNHAAPALEILEPRILLDAWDDYWSGDDGLGDSTSNDQSATSQPADTQPSDTQPTTQPTDTTTQPDNSSDNGSGDFSQTDDSGPDDSTSPTIDYTDVVQPPSVPSKLTAQALSPTSIYLSWCRNSSDADGFTIARATPGGGWTLIATVGSGTTHFTDQGLTPGTTYTYAVAAFNSAGSSGFSFPTSAMTLAANDPTLVGQFGHLAGGTASAPLSFTDSDGTKVTLTLNGPGSGALHLTASGYAITLAGTSLASTFKITTARSLTPGDDGRFQLASLTVGNPAIAQDQTSLGTLDAKTTDLNGTLIITGTIQHIQLGNVSGEILLHSAGGLSNTTSGVNLTLGQVNDASLVSGIGIENLTVTSWTSPGASDVLAAPYMNVLHVTGGKLGGAASHVAGDFQPTLLLTGAAIAPRQNVLNRVSITGSIGTAPWTIIGHIGSIQIGAATRPFAATAIVGSFNPVQLFNLDNGLNNPVVASGKMVSFPATLWASQNADTAPPAIFSEPNIDAYGIIGAPITASTA